MSENKRPTVSESSITGHTGLGSPSVGKPAAGRPTGGDPSLLGEIQSEAAVEAAPLLTFIVSNMRVIVGAILLLLVATVGYGVWQWQDAKNVREAQIELGRILVRDSGEARVKALQAFLATAPPHMRGAVLLELASSAVAAENFNTAVDAYKELANSQTGTALGMVAALNESSLLQRQNQPAEALLVLEKLLPSLPENLRPAVREQIGSTAEQAGDIEKALKYYEEILLPIPGEAPRSETETAFYRARIQTLKARNNTAK